MSNRGKAVSDRERPRYFDGGGHGNTSRKTFSERDCAQHVTVAIGRYERKSNPAHVERLNSTIVLNSQPATNPPSALRDQPQAFHIAGCNLHAPPRQRRPRLSCYSRQHGV